MRYADIRRKIKSGDILAWSHRGWGSWYDFQIQMIRVFKRTEYVHTGTAWVVGNRVFVLEAVQPKVRIYPLSKLGDFYWLPIGAYWRKKTEEFALSKVGDDYSKWQAFLSFFGIRKKDNLRFCSEYVHEICEVDGIDLGDDLTPSGIVKAAQARGAPLHLIKN